MNAPINTYTAIGECGPGYDVSNGEDCVFCMEIGIQILIGIFGPPPELTKIDVVWGQYIGPKFPFIALLLDDSLLDTSRYPVMHLVPGERRIEIETYQRKCEDFLEGMEKQKVVNWDYLLAARRSNKAS